MMVGNNQVQPQAARGFGLGKGSHAGVHGNHQPNALRVSLFQHARLQPVPLAQPVRHMEARIPAQHLDSRLQQHDGGGAVHVVIAIEQHRLARGDSLLQPLHGGLHAQHQKGIVQVRNFRIKKSECFRRLGNAARHQQLGQHLRQARSPGQRHGLVRMRLDETPALARRIQRQAPRRNLSRSWPIAFSARPAHRGYSSSSLPSCSWSPMTMS